MPAPTTDPLAEIVTLLKPGAGLSKWISAVGPWRVKRGFTGDPFYCVVLEGSMRITVNKISVVLEKNDFVLVPAAEEFMSSSVVPAKEDTLPVRLPSGEHRHGPHRGEPNVRALIGHCTFGSPDANLLVSLLPRFVHIRGQERLRNLVQLVRDESVERRPARDVVLSHFIEVLFIEALRSTSDATELPSLIRGLADEHLAIAIRHMHQSPTKPWTVVQLAKAAGLSRSTFFERFNRAVGVAPMEYLLGWRMALAKDLFRQSRVTVAEVAERVGYGSASTFSVAFTRHVGMPPTQYAKQIQSA